ncbi:MAG: adenylate/guanylate cyclase domain-containing protein [Bacteroidales bacterium]|nr:adenylate/guanylate cyclase domain-containing protein [Bacteroidales bacterium]
MKPHSSTRHLMYLLYQIIFWYGVLLFYLFITGSDKVFTAYFNLLRVQNIYFNLLVFGTAISFWFFFLNLLFTDRITRLFPMQMIVFIKWLIYFGSAFFLMLLAARISLRRIDKENYEALLKQIPRMDIHFFRFLAYFYLSGIIYNFLKAMRMRMGRMNFIRWFFGILSKPREEERIFMFIDMKSSTSIAEKLMHRKFSYLVQDVFNQMNVFGKYHGEIYQYLGDGAIISWNVSSGMRDSNYLKAFFAFRKRIGDRERYFIRKYGLVPGFKAGVHIGKVMMLQVGQARRDISYNGDTINTAARIEGMCNEYNSELLISQDLYMPSQNQGEFLFKEMGKIKLKGKRKSTGLYQVKERKSRK